MHQEISDVLSASISGYLRFFETSAALGSALFGVAVFLIIRAIGIIRDEDVAEITHIRLIVTSGMCALVMIIVGFIAQNVALSFNIELLSGEAHGGCQLPDDKLPATFFMECHRKVFRGLVWINLLAAFLGIASIGSWFVNQSRRVSNESS